jgi:DNA-binding IclR family transcriptional regulator
MNLQSAILYYLSGFDGGVSGTDLAPLAGCSRSQANKILARLRLIGLVNQSNGLTARGEFWCEQNFGRAA